MKAGMHVWSHIVEFFLEQQHMFQTIQLVAKIKIRIWYSIFLENRAVWDDVQKYCTSEQATDDAHAHCVLDN